MLSGGAARVLMCRLCPDPGLSAGGARLAENRHQCLQGRKWEHLQPCAGGGLRIRRPHCPPPLGRCVLAVLLNKSFALQHYLLLEIRRLWGQDWEVLILKNSVVTRILNTVT